MNSLCLAFLLLSAPAIPSPAPGSGGGAGAPALASARILRGEAVRMGPSVGVEARETSGGRIGLAPVRSSAESRTRDGRMLRLQEFH